MSDDSMMVFAGNANPELAQDVVDHLGLSLGKINVGSFSDGKPMSKSSKTFADAMPLLFSPLVRQPTIT